MQLPGKNKDIQELRENILRVGVGRLVFWFFAINLPIAIVLSALIGWHSSMVGPPTGLHLLIRGIVAFVAFAIGLVAFLLRIRSLARRQ
jgi:hypothetical protein